MAELSGKKEQAAVLVAADEKTNQEIADAVDVSLRTLTDWKQRPEFTARVDEVIGEIRAALLRHGVARVDRRMARYQRDWTRLQRVIEERADNGDGKPGTRTGHIVKVVTPGEWGDRVEYKLDPAPLAALLAIESQVAKELGQWTQRTDLTTGGARMGGPDLRALTDAQIAALEAILDGSGADGTSLDDAHATEGAPR